MSTKKNLEGTNISDEDFVGFSIHRGLIMKIMVMIFGKSHLHVAKKIYDGGNGDRTIKRRSHLAMLMGLILTILIGMIVVILLPQSNIIYHLMFVTGVGSIIVAFLTVLKRWVFFNEIVEYLMMRVREDSEHFEKSMHEKRVIVDEYLGMYFSTLTGRIMSIGVIPIILGIVVIILADLSGNPSATKLFQNTPYEFDIIFILLLLGGATEALAFFFGFLFPETPAKKLSESTKNTEGNNGGTGAQPPVTNQPQDPNSPTLTIKEIEDVVVKKLNNVQVTATVRTV